MDIWKLLESHFKPTGTKDNFGNPSELSGLLLLTLHIIRTETGWPMSIHNAVESSGHSKGSQHYLCNALDCHFITDVPFRQQITKVELILSKFQLADFMGVGIYPFWNNPGFHFDARGSRARWGYDQAGKMKGYDLIKESVK